MDSFYIIINAQGQATADCQTKYRRNIIDLGTGRLAIKRQCILIFEGRDKRLQCRVDTVIGGLSVFRQVPAIK